MQALYTGQQGCCGCQRIDAHVPGTGEVATEPESSLQENHSHQSMSEVGMTLAERARAVQTRNGLSAFVAARKADFDASGSHWTSSALASFLEPLAAWVQDMDGYYQNTDQKLSDLPPLANPRRHPDGRQHVRAIATTTWSYTFQPLASAQQLTIAHIPYGFRYARPS
jgi:hypothetical protein